MKLCRAGADHLIVFSIRTFISLCVLLLALSQTGGNRTVFFSYLHVQDFIQSKPEQLHLNRVIRKIARGSAGVPHLG